ncbi:MAG TPA: YigZ family protein [Thermoanaerobaculia bacterium]|nr:YigZ family protein [Thermoanaerobaculia bacterium]HUM30439.1 YigZ family protein [Thermoanaerobaculia bacterium]HXK68694.1 YigZ family protein [Thermoanaerobaculia bacterium]
MVRSVQGESFGQYSERGSKFLAHLFPIGNEDAFFSRLEALHREHHASRHLCWAFRLPDMERFSDAGEPRGTAGPPLLNLLSGLDLLLAGLIVVRYFGGVKLGTGNLARAYRTAGEEAVAGAHLILITEQIDMILHSTPAQVGEIFSLLDRLKIQIIDQAYSPAPRIWIRVESSRMDEVIDGFKARGLQFERGGRAYHPVKPS